MSKPKFQVGDLVKVKQPPSPSHALWYKLCTKDWIGLIIRVIQPDRHSHQLGYGKQHYYGKSCRVKKVCYEIEWFNLKPWQQHAKMSIRRGFKNGFYPYNSGDLELLSRPNADVEKG